MSIDYEDGSARHGRAVPAAGAHHADARPAGTGPGNGGCVMAHCRPLNVVPDHHCPFCFLRSPMTVWQGHVSWKCGHAQALPPLPTERGAPGRKATR